MSSSVTTGSSLVGGGAFTMSSHARPTALCGTAGFVFPGFCATRAASRALNAGIDLILVSYDPAQFHHDERVITADRAGGLVPVALAGSARRWLVRHDN
jgi:hypothetical protein